MNAGLPPGGRRVVLAGSASAMTNAQVARYAAIAASGPEVMIAA